MATQKVVTVAYTRTDDLTGEKATDGEVVNFAVNGVKYAIDLSEANVKNFHAVLAPYVEAATVRKAGRTTADPELAAVRAFGQENGFKVGDRGRIAANVWDAYRAAQAVVPPVAEAAAEAVEEAVKAKPAPRRPAAKK